MTATSAIEIVRASAFSGEPVGKTSPAARSAVVVLSPPVVGDDPYAAGCLDGERHAAADEVSQAVAVRLGYG